MSPWVVFAASVTVPALARIALGESPGPHEAEPSTETEPPGADPAAPDFAPGPASDPSAPPEPSSKPPRTRADGGGEESTVRRKVPMQNGMLRIPGGEFTMGYEGPPPGEPNERPAHVVRVAPFWIDRTEVTVTDMRSCLNRGDCKAALGKGPACTFEHADRPSGPAALPLNLKSALNCVSWQSADAYCRAVGKRLPTEAEWEFAAGAGQRTRFPWGSRPPSCALAVTLASNRSGASCSPRGPAEVGSHPKGQSPFGVEDMAGNVEEWVADWYADRYAVEIPGRAAPAGPAFGVAHVLRGGGWMSRPRETRVTARSWASPNESGPNVGFRCARD
ncbi:MAG TPA: SUMF1/EgtB/PvdO family nonheme iron enzyme [Polyangiaceae bacterium]|nr:SUMF1/EgtB/PvdO family nonheme iron enzyme [Polyangiaceae bacterium]